MVWVSIQFSLMKLDRIQNEVMRVILGTTKETPIETLHYLLDLLSLGTGNKVEHVKVYLNTIQNPNISTPRSCPRRKGCRLAKKQVKV